MALVETTTRLEACEGSIGYTFTNKAHLVRAVNASGNPTMFQGQQVQENKALAVFGDVAMEAHLCRLWLATDTSKGKTALHSPCMITIDIIFRLAVWDSIRQSVLVNVNLARVGFEAGLNVHVQVYAFTAVSAKMMATTVEAIAGAAYLDGGEPAMVLVMHTLGITDARLNDTTASVTSKFLHPALPIIKSTLRLLANMAFRSPCMGPFRMPGHEGQSQFRFAPP